jgi:hypothetical protein
MRRKQRALVWVLLFLLFLSVQMPVQAAAGGPQVDLTDRLNEIFRLRSQWLITGDSPPPIDADFVPNLAKAKWALNHEHGKIRYMQIWAKNRGVQFVEATPSLYIKYLGGDEKRARFYIGQTLALGYVYPGESAVNRFGVGSRHVLELRLEGDKWLLASEWYTDPLGDDTEVPDVTPALVPPDADRRAGLRGAAYLAAAAVPAAAPKGYDRDGAIAYADRFCGLAWGCGNDHRYNRRYRDYNGNGGDCTNYVSQALREGGRLPVPSIIRVSNLAGYLQGTGRARLVARAPFQELWKRVAKEPKGFQSLVTKADVIAYQEKGKLEHFAIITGFDTRGYPLVNSHTADRFRVPFDLGWDRKTVYWFLHING